MSLDELLGALDKLDNEADRTSYIASVLSNPNHPHLPGIPHGAYPIRDEWPSEGEIERFEHEQNESWRLILNRFEHPPLALEEALYEFEQNLSRMYEADRMPEDRRAKMPLSNLPEYRGRNLLNKVKRAIPFWESEEITVASIDSNRLGSGGYADVHMLHQPDGSKKVIKLFRPPYLLEPDLREARQERLELIKDNLFENRRFFSSDPIFASLRSIPYDFSFYVADFVEGVSLSDLIKRPEDPRIPLGLAGLSHAIEKAHDRDMVFVDVKPDSVLISEDSTVRICDYDFVMSADRVNGTHDQFRLVKAPIYLPRESFDTSILVGPMADLEQLSYVIDHMYNGNPMLKPEAFTEQAERAQNDHRSYPRHRAERVPSPVRELVRATLTYPRDDTVSASDFSKAFREILYDQ